MTIKSLIRKGCSNRHIARLLRVSENTVRYHRRRQAEDAVDGHSRQAPVAAAYRDAIDAYLEARNVELSRQLEWFKRQLFGRKSEKRLPDDLAEQPLLTEGGR